MYLYTSAHTEYLITERNIKCKLGRWNLISVMENGVILICPLYSRWYRISYRFPIYWQNWKHDVSDRICWHERYFSSFLVLVLFVASGWFFKLSFMSQSSSLLQRRDADSLSIQVRNYVSVCDLVEVILLLWRRDFSMGLDTHTYTHLSYNGRYFYLSCLWKCRKGVEV